ncbi:MAG: serine hydrolase [Desulfobacteraceae bacterium]|nr:serine hydrolase [Desulfobacteraceae bacterium]
MIAETRNLLESLLREGVHGGVYPGAVLLVAQAGEIAFLKAIGYLSLRPKTAAMQKETIFDLASLTKPLATTLAIMKLLDDGIIKLDQTLDTVLSSRVPREKIPISLRMLLSHSAGFPDWKPFHNELVGFPLKERKEQLRRQLLRVPLIFGPGQEALYSDLGFMILEWIIEETAGVPMNLFLDRHFYNPLSLERTFICDTTVPGRFKANQFAATEDCPWREEVIQGVVHDENAYALGGHSGHAGLFGTCEEVYVLVSLLMNHFYGRQGYYLRPETVRTFFTRQRLVKDGTWALGWDTPSPKNSSSGRYFSENSVGHLGFTGTSVWLDLDRDVTVIFLTNRVHPKRNNEKIRAFRPILHDTIMENL